MRQVVYSVASSLDGFISGPEGEHDWIPMDVGIDWGNFLARFDTALLGRRSFEASLETSGEDFLGDMRRYVFSTTLRQKDHPGVTIVSEEAARVVTELRREEGLRIWLFGGGSLFRSLLDAGVVSLRYRC